MDIDIVGGFLVTDVMEDGLEEPLVLQVGDPVGDIAVVQ